MILADNSAGKSQLLTTILKLLWLLHANLFVQHVRGSISFGGLDISYQVGQSPAQEASGLGIE